MTRTGTRSVSGARTNANASAFTNWRSALGWRLAGGDVYSAQEVAESSPFEVDVVSLERLDRDATCRPLTVESAPSDHALYSPSPAKYATIFP